MALEMPPWARRLAWGSLAAVVVAVIAVTALALWSVRRPFPEHSGQASLPALDAPVEALRDDAGVPHLYAATSADLYRAQGYVHAQDRFWQMDTWRHITAGRTAELFGPDALDNDRFLRTLGWTRLAEAELELLSREDRAVLEAYAEGVNAYLEQREPGALSLAYTVLGLQHPGYEPEPWEPVHTLAFLKLMAWDLGGNMSTEIERTALGQSLGAEQAGDLFPGYPDDVPVIVEQEATAALERLDETLDGVDVLGGARTEGLGSNSWVVAGQHTASGRPLLANDPHLSIGSPSIWYEVGLHCTSRDERCTEHVAGFSFAGVPGVVIGHNDRVAWGFTNLGADVQDLYLERIDPEDPTRHEVEGEWVDMDVRTETLRASDGTQETLTIRSTRNGPLISETYGPVEELDTDGYAVALRWTALDPGTTFAALPRLNRARDASELRAAAEPFEVPSQSIVYADVDGAIGYQAPGRIPVRADGHDGRLPVPGWDDDYQWQGFIDYGDLPREVDPERGWIVSANNPVVGDDYPYVLSTDWAYGYRARRITELLAGAQALTVADMQAMQTDTFDASASFLVPALLALDADDGGPVAQMQQVLDGWDHHAAPGSPAAAAYAATWRALLARTFGERLPETHQPAGSSRWFAIVEGLLDDPGNGWWGPGGRDAALAGALAAAHTELTESLGSNPAGWEWGDLHTATFREGTLGESGIAVIEDRFNRGPVPVGGGSAIVNATGWDASQGYEVQAIPSMRTVVDLADLDRSTRIHPPGQSGHPYHPGYHDQVEPWAAGEQRPAPFTRAAVEEAAELRLELVP